MSHCDEETLGLLALGEHGPAPAEAHVAACPQCAGELAALRSVAGAFRGPGVNADPVTRVAPPPRVWARIAAATGVQDSPRPDEVARHTTTLGPPPALHPPAPAPEPPAPAPVGAAIEPAQVAPVRVEPAPVSAPVAPVTPGPAAPTLPRQRSWVSRLDARLLTVAAGCLVVGLLGGVFGTRLLGGDNDPVAPVVAATRLAGLPAAPAASGQADVVESGQGRTLDLDVRALGAPDGFYEVWLIDPTVTKMVPVGVLNGATGRFALPAGVDLADYPLVDISVEPLDGNPAHSGKSVLRGTLQS